MKKTKEKNKDVGFFTAYKIAWKVMTKHQKFKFITYIFLGVITAFTFLIPTQVISIVISKLTGDPLMFFGILLPNNISILVVLLIGFALSFTCEIANNFINIGAEKFAEKVACDLQVKAFDWLLIPRKNMDIKMTQGDASYRITSASKYIGDIIGNTICSILPLFFSSIIAFIYIISIEIMSLPILLVAMVIIGFVAYIRNIKEKPITVKSEKYNSRLSNFAVNAISNLPIINLYKSMKHEKDLFQNKSDEYYEQAKKSYNIRIWYWIVIGFVDLLATYAIILLASLKSQSGAMVASNVIIIINYVVQVFNPIESFGWFYGNTIQSGIKLNRVVELIPNNNDIINQEQDNYEGNINSITLKDICIRNGEDVLIKDINLHLNIGELTVFVGESGCGKTSALRVLCGLSEVESGNIFINDTHSVKTMFNLTNKFSVVMQSPHIFNRDVKDNVLYPNYTENAFTEDIIKKLSMDELYLRKFDEDCEQNLENMLSGGEKKRICVSRGLIKECDVYIFDEPTNELDGKNTNEILRLIQKLKNDAIVIVVTHDKRIIDKADNVIDFGNKKQ